MMFDRSGPWRFIAAVQGAYYLITGVWPIIHMGSFLAVTGPKHDLWLVQFFGALVCLPAVVLLHAVRTRRLTMQGFIVAAGFAAILLVGDVIFVWLGAIGPIYLLDAAAELALLIAWTIAAVRTRTRTAASTASR